MIPEERSIFDLVENVKANPDEKDLAHHNHGWNYWGFQNDWLQHRMVKDLNAMTLNDIRFKQNGKPVQKEFNRAGL